MDKVFDLIKEAGTFFYATTDENGNPRVRPYGFIMKFNGKLFFGMGKHKPSFAQTVAHPVFEICAFVPAKMQWVRLEGTAVLDESEETYEAAMADSPQLKGMYPESKLLGNFYIKDATATISSFSGDPEVIKF